MAVGQEACWGALGCHVPHTHSCWWGFGGLAGLLHYSASVGRLREAWSNGCACARRAPLMAAHQEAGQDPSDQGKTPRVGCWVLLVPRKGAPVLAGGWVHVAGTRTDTTVSC